MSHIQRTTVDVLCRYLEQYDPLDHEHQYGSLSGLLDILEQIGLPYMQDSRGVTHTLTSLRSRVYRFLERFSRAPVACPENIAGFLGVLRRAGITPSSLNLQRYTWDFWELRALDAGVPPDLAAMGRGALRRQHFCENPINEMDPDVLLYMAINTPDQAEAMFMRLLVHSSIDSFSSANPHDVFH